MGLSDSGVVSDGVVSVFASSSSLVSLASKKSSLSLSSSSECSDFFSSVTGSASFPVSLSLISCSGLGSGASKNFSRMELSSQLKISLTVNGNLRVVRTGWSLLVAYVVGGVFLRHHSDVINQFRHFVVVEASMVKVSALTS